MRSQPYKDLNCQPMEQVSALSFSDKFATNSLTPKGWKACLACAENPNQEPGTGCRRQSAPSSSAPHARHGLSTHWNCFHDILQKQNTWPQSTEHLRLLPRNTEANKDWLQLTTFRLRLFKHVIHTIDFRMNIKISKSNRLKGKFFSKGNPLFWKNAYFEITAILMTREEEVVGFFRLCVQLRFAKEQP